MADFVKYQPKTWASREFIKRTDMNHLEEGVKYNSEAIEALQKQIDTMRYIYNTHIYGVKFDKVNNKCTRLWDAANITTDTSQFRYTSTSSTVNNPFDSIYPWSEFELCNVDLAVYKALPAGSSVREAIIAWYDDPDYTDTDPTKFVGRYRPEYWFTGYEDGDYQIFAIADKEIEGWGYSPECVDSYSFVNDDGSNPTGTDSTGTITCYNGGQPLTNISVASIHTRAKNTGFTLENIYSVSAIQTAYVVEYANMNIQNALGAGCSNCYRQSSDQPLVDATASTTVILPKACEAFAIEGVTMDFGASNGAVVLANRRKCMGHSAYTDDANYITVTIDKPLDITTSMFVSFHGAVNTAVPPGNHSGYIGTDGKLDAFYRGAVIYGNRWSYVLGAYRQTETQSIWIAKDIYECDNYDALNTTNHIDTELVLPTTNNYIQELYTYQQGGLGALPWCKSIGGNATAPVGDYFYTNATAGNTILLLGGYGRYGPLAGCFYGAWDSVSSVSLWYCGGRAVLFSKNNNN